jgi:hypothetical protein
MTDLAIMNRDMNTAKQNFHLISEKDSAIAFQKKVLGVMMFTIGNDIRTDNSQDYIGKELNILLKNRAHKFESEQILHSLFNFLKDAFENKGQSNKAYLLSYIASEKLSRYDGGEYAIIRGLDDLDTEKEIMDIIALFDKKEKNELEKLLVSPFPHPYYFWEVLGTVRLRNGATEKAKQAFKEIPDDVWTYNLESIYHLNENPFVLSHLKNTSSQYVYWNKAEITDSLYSLESKKDKTSKEYQLLANAWFNFSKFGNSWYMLDYYYNSSFLFQDEWTAEYYSLTYSINQFALNRSIQYYQSALKLSKDKEEKTEIIYMLAYCYYMLDDRGDYITWARQYEQMKNTQFYKGEKCTITPKYDKPKFLDNFFSKKKEN